MFLDLLTRVTTNQAFTATAVTTDSIDLGNPTPKNEIGAGEDIAAVFTVTAAADAGNSDETYLAEVITSAAGALTSPTVIGQASITRGSAIGTRVVIPIPPGSVTQRYLGGRMTLGGTTPAISVTVDFLPLSFIEKQNRTASGYFVNQ